MTDVADLLPALGLRVSGGDLELRGVTDDLVAELADLAARGVHHPDRMPFTYPWTDAAPEDFGRSFAQYHWRTRAEFSPSSWALNLAVLHRGRVVGVQGVTTSDFLVTRTGETGSWLGLAHQGKGLGTVMRQVMCAFLFDHLDFTEITSGAFSDNPASLTVSAKVGHVANGTRRLERRGEQAEMTQLVLTPAAFRRGPQALEVEGVDAFRRLIGLDVAS
ncbi:MAG: family acetyltransferase [Nocardioides sp.]|jgi:RimJ/RimL family protein N-acetyltransferase|uniref:GNAT family N-acetyltransferase n=1 Tax=Nocardioides sp. TaxID=35761 RepID=UPI002613BB16|nr:GNAT family protein [Nocardioides sp.]MCW2835063.1 family acetyltransferase [Nocardioides sp.]